MRVTSRLWPAPTMRAAMAAICVGRLALAEDHFREALARRPVVIDAGEAEVFERRLAQKLKELLVRSLRCQAAAADVVEEGAQLLSVHPANALDNVDFGPSWTVI